MVPEKRIFFFKIALTAGFFLGIFFAPKLWLSSRSYPLTPVVALARIPEPFDFAALAVLIGLLAAVVVSARPRRYLVALLALLLVLGLGDQSRWWPSFYEYTLMFLVLAFYPWEGGDLSRQRHALNTLRFIVCGVYFWSGAQKINPYFADSFSFRFISPYVESLPPSVRDAIPYIIGLVPLVEIAFAAGLLTRRWRAPALTAALAMHTLIFFGIGPLAGNWNNSAWAWNLATASVVFILFWREREETFHTIVFDWRSVPRILVLVLIGVSPLLNFFGRWDSALAFDVYSGNARTGVIYVDYALMAKLPLEIERHVEPASGGRGMLAVWDWTAAEFNAGPYAEVRVFKNVLRKICSYGDGKNGALLVVREKGTWVNGWSRPLLKYNCGEV